MLSYEADVTVGSIANKNVLSCPPDNTLHEVVQQMQEWCCSCMVVVEGGIPIGIWTEADALKLDLNRPDIATASPIREFMNRPVKTVHCSNKVYDVAIRFQEERIRHLVVIDDDNNMLGIVTQSDVVWNQGPEGFLYLREVHSALCAPLLELDGGMLLQEVTHTLRDAGGDAAVVRDRSSGEYGILTERDIVRLIAAQAFSQPIEQLAHFPLVTIKGEQTLVDAKGLLMARNIRHLGVLNKDAELIGLLSFSDILRSIRSEYVRQLRDALEQRDQALDRARKNLLLAHSVIESTMEGIMVTGPDGTIEMVNPAFSAITGYSLDEVVGKKPNILKSGRHDDAFYLEMWEQIDTKGSWRGEVWNKRKSGEIYPEWLSINTVFGDEGDSYGYAAIFSDITERKKNEERINNLAYYDILTGLPNRRLFMDRLALAIANAKRHEHQLGIMFLDLDLFKRINDTLGHNAGDQVLKDAASRLLGCVREGDTLARLGGDEFVILLPELEDDGEVVLVARRALESFKNTFAVHGQRLNITTSIGIGLFPNDGDDAETLLKNADTAMYRVKDTGRNGFEMYSAIMNKYSLKRLSMETGMRKALDNDEFFLNYQVKLDLVTEQIAGVEGLIRWDHPEMGVVPPMEFIPVAEQNGMIVPIGEWVLKEACRQNRRWHEMGLPRTPIAINMSTLQFCKEGIVEAIEDALGEVGIEPQYLELEVTESSVMQKIDRAIHTLERFRELGVVVAIDDFGTGFSSLSYLKDLPIDRLKIDRSFLHNLHDNTKNQAIVSSIIELARRLGIRVIAEGVEDYLQVDFLRREGCHEVQGYLISRPISPDNIASLHDQRLLPIRPEN